LRQGGPSMAAILGPGGPSMVVKIAIDGLGDHLQRRTNCGMTGPLSNVILPSTESHFSTQLAEKKGLQ